RAHFGDRAIPETVFAFGHAADGHRRVGRLRSARGRSIRRPRQHAVYVDLHLVVDGCAAQANDMRPGAGHGHFGGLSLGPGAAAVTVKEQPGTGLVGVGAQGPQVVVLGNDRGILSVLHRGGAYPRGDGVIHGVQEVGAGGVFGHETLAGGTVGDEVAVVTDAAFFLAGRVRLGPAVLYGSKAAAGGVGLVDLAAFAGTVHVPHGGEALGGVEHGRAVRFAGGGFVAPVHADRGIAVACDAGHADPDVGTVLGPALDLIAERGVAGFIGEPDVRAARLGLG